MAAAPMVSKVVAGPLRTFTASPAIVSRGSLTAAVVGVMTGLTVGVNTTIVVKGVDVVIGTESVAVGVGGFSVGVGVAGAAVSTVGVKVGTAT